MNEELDSQLSAMFDDELPPAECELLARRLSRDELLKARWGRYAVVGAVIRAERGVRLNAPLAGRVNAVIARRAGPRRARGAAASRSRARLRWWQPVAGGRRGRGRRRACRCCGCARRRRSPGHRSPRNACPPPWRRTGSGRPAGRRRRRDSYVVPPDPSGAPDAGAEHRAGQLRGRAQRVFLAGRRGATCSPRSSRASRPPRSAEEPRRTMSKSQCAVASESLAALALGLPRLPARRWPRSRRSWLERMNQALTTRNYDGTFSHWHGGQVEMLRIIHRVQDGAVSERLASLDGSGREFIRTGASLACYLPDKRTVVVEQRPPQESAGRLPGGQRADRELLRHQGSGAHAPEPPRHPRDHGHAEGRVPLRLPAVDR